MANSIKFKANYDGTDKTRIYTIEDVADSIASASSALALKVYNINASLASGEATALAETFVSDDYDPDFGVGTLSKITDVQIRTVEEIPISQG